MDPLLTEILALSKWIKVQAVGSLGPLGPGVTTAGYLMVAAVALMLLVSGRGFWSPPTPELRRFPARIAGVIIAVAVVGIHWSVTVNPSTNLLPWAGILVATAVFGALLYLFLRLAMCFRCDPDPKIYVKGLWRTANAKLRMSGHLTGHPMYDVPGAPPINTQAYFCGSKGDPYFVWPQASLALAQVVLFISYLIFIVPLTLGLTCASIALTQLDVRETAANTQIDLSTDVLFDFGKSTIRAEADGTLIRSADLLRNRKVTAVLVQGHSDTRGTPDYNVKLSRQRAEAVRDRLAREPGLNQVAFRVEAFGATRPVAPNTKNDGTDNPEGRKQNRRVTLVIDK